MFRIAARRLSKKLDARFQFAFFLLLIGFLMVGNGALLSAKDATPAPEPKPLSPAALKAKEALLQTWSSGKFRFTPKVRDAYLDYAKAKAQSDLTAMNKKVPKEFLAWIDKNPEIEASVYSANENSAHVILMLYSLKLDLGKEKFERYRQLALAMAIVHEQEGPKADLSPRDPLKLTIPPCPLKPVNTKDPNRKLDRNDHIINFLNENFIEDVPDEKKWAPPTEALVYDEKGVAIKDATAEKKRAEELAKTSKIKRPLVAADVFASRALQEKFNAYMKAHGEDVEIDCGDHVIFPNRTEMITGPEGKKINEAFELFKAAYIAKGLLPGERDPTPSPAEACAFLIRNNECNTPPVDPKKKPPHFPLTSPWPLMTMLAADEQALREREDIWIRYHDKGELRTYGEYIGGIAQQFHFQSARRLCPYPYAYNTFQMMCKDGGVCGTMANMETRVYKSLGIPACTAGQPGHCAMIYFAQDPKTGLFDCRGGQFVTAGPEGTHPHTPWQFGNGKFGHKGMIHYQSIAWAVNYGFAQYLDSTMAYQIFMLLPDEEKKSHGLTLLESAIASNPYNFLVIDAAQANAADPQSLVRFWKAFDNKVSAVNKPGCPATGLYNQTAWNATVALLAKMPVPKEKIAVKEVLTVLENEKCTHPVLMTEYRLAGKGLPKLLSLTQTDLKAHLASDRTEESCKIMAESLQAVAGKIPEEKQKLQWLQLVWKDMKGREFYFDKKNQICTDATGPVLAKLTNEKPKSETDMVQPLLNQLATELMKSVNGVRDPKACGQLAGKITSTANYLKDPDQKKKWLEKLAKIMNGKEMFAHGKAKPMRDPCADAILKLLNPPS